MPQEAGAREACLPNARCRRWPSDHPRALFEGAGAGLRAGVPKLRGPALASPETAVDDGGDQQYREAT